MERFIKLIMILLVLQIASCSGSEDLSDVSIPTVDEILGLAEVNASDSKYVETEYVVGQREPSHYYLWKVSSGQFITDQGKGNIWVKLKAPNPGKLSNVEVSVTIYDKYPDHVLKTLTKIVKVK